MADTTASILTGGLSDATGAGFLTHGLGSAASSSPAAGVQNGDLLSYVRADSGQDLEDDGPAGPGTLRVSLRPYVTYTVGDGNLSAALAARLLQDNVCVKRS